MEIWLDFAAIYVALAFSFLALPLTKGNKEAGFCALNLGFSFLCFFYLAETPLYRFPLYLGFAALYYALLAFHARYGQRIPLPVIIAVPILALVAAKSIGVTNLLGFSYFTFRLSYLGYELYAGRAAMPGLARFFGFTFFPLTFIVGPISPYSLYAQSLDQRFAAFAPYSRCLGRILVGIIKCYIFSELFKTLGFFSFWDSNYKHNIGDFTISCIATTLYIYFNFSGACDMMIGASGLLGIKVQENFNNPFLSRNLAEYWSRNHITLTQAVRNLFFIPGQLALSRLLNGKYARAVSYLMIMVTFVIIGIWHGNSIGYVYFGIMHGLGVIAVNSYQLLWRKFPPHVQHFTNTPAMRALSTALTFMYVCYSTVFFSHSAKELHEIFARLTF